MTPDDELGPSRRGAPDRRLLLALPLMFGLYVALDIAWLPDWNATADARLVAKLSLVPISFLLAAVIARVARKSREAGSSVLGIVLPLTLLFGGVVLGLIGFRLAPSSSTTARLIGAVLVLAGSIMLTVRQARSFTDT